MKLDRKTYRVLAVFNAALLAVVVGAVVYLAVKGAPIPAELAGLAAVLGGALTGLLVREKTPGGSDNGSEPGGGDNNGDRLE